MGDFFKQLQLQKAGVIEKPVKDKSKGIAKESEKKKAQREASKEDDAILEQWFLDRSREMKGKCVECGGKSTKGNPQYWKYSICHILPKAIFTSIATHPLNFIELCHFDNSHHNNFDTLGYEWAREHMTKAWKIIVQRFILMYPSIAKEERSKIPDILLQELEPEK